MMKEEALEFLTNVAMILGARSVRYGDPNSFFCEVAKRWTITLRVPVTPEQVVLCMIDMKLQRLCHDPGQVDSMLDIAGYAACLERVHSK